MFRAHLFGVLAIGLAVLSSCAVSPPEEVWRTDAPTLGPPVVEGDVAIAYVEGLHGLEIAAWALDDGRELWRRAALPGFTPAGFTLTPAVLGREGSDVVAYLVPGPEQPDGRRYYAVALADTKTGGSTLAGEGAPVVPDRRPEVCGDDEGDFCFNGREVGTGRSGVYRVDAETGEIDWTEDDGGFEIGAGLRITGDGALVLSDGDWSTSYETVFGEGYTTGFGWDWRRADEADLLIGSAGRRAEDGEYAHPDLTTDATVALDPSDGSVVWLRHGTNTGCALVRPIEHAWCRILSGRWDESTPPENPEFVDLEIAVEGFDPETGDVLWSVPVPSAEAAMWGREEPRFAHFRDRLVLVTDDGAVTVDVESGELGCLGPDATLLCLRRTEIELTGYHFEEGATYYGGDVARPCDVHGRDATGVPERELLEATGVATPDGGILLAGFDGLRLYR